MTINHLNLKLWIFSGHIASFKIRVSKVHDFWNLELSPMYLILLQLCFSVVIMVQCYTMAMLVHPTVNSFMMGICGMIWTILWDSLFLQFTNIKVKDQSEHSLRLVCAFDVPYLKSFRQNFKILTSQIITWLFKVRNRAKIRNPYNQASHLYQDTNGKVTTSQFNITNESQEVSPFPAGDHKATINRHTQTHNKNKTEIT